MALALDPPAKTDYPPALDPTLYVADIPLSSQEIPLEASYIEIDEDFSLYGYVCRCHNGKQHKR